MAKRNALIRARTRLGLSRPAFARVLGVSDAMVFSVEHGRRDPSLHLARKWVKQLGFDATMDLFRSRPRRPAEPNSRAAE
jgi:DNA-binding XRE family transcriptional regulator